MIDKQQLMQDFLLKTPIGYHAQSLNRASHLRASNLRKASVLVGFVERQQGLSVLFTKRAGHLKHHPGQISFPGGKFEKSDGNLYQTAKREAKEEIGLEEDCIHILGQLPELVTISHFAVTPIVALIDPSYEMVIDHNEVEEVFEVPASYLLNAQHLLSNTFLIKNSLHKVFAVPYKHHFIWGMTAQIIQALQNHIND